MKGKITQWNDRKGFGFIIPDDGSENVFFHISRVKNGTRRPQVGDVVVFESSHDNKGRLQARAVAIEGAVASGRGPRAKSAAISITPPRKNALDYLLILAMLGCAGILSWHYLLTGRLATADAPLAIAAILALLILTRQKKPKESHFSCARCRTVAPFDARTIQAWNNGFVKLYCSACHKRWLAENSQHNDYAPTLINRYRPSGQGCFGLLCLLVLLPIATGIAVYRYFV